MNLLLICKSFSSEIDNNFSIFPNECSGGLFLSFLGPLAVFIGPFNGFHNTKI